MKFGRISGIAAVMMVSGAILSGCGQTTTASGTGNTAGTASGQKETLNFWIFDNPPMVTETKQLVKEYEQQHPNISVDLTVLPNSDYAQKYTVALGTGTGPDVLLTSDRSVPTLVQKKVLAPIDPSAFGFSSIDDLKSNWLSGSLDGLTESGQIYGIPMEFDTFSLYINKQLFQKAGLDPVKDAPKTWDQLEQVASKLTVRQNGQLVQAGFGFPTFSGGWDDLIMDPMIRQLGGTLVDDNGTTAHFTSPQVKQVFQTWSDIYNKYKTADPGFGTASATNPNQSFIDGKVAMWISGPWAVPTITQGTAAYNNYEVVPVPQYDPSNPVSLVYSWNWSVSAASKHVSDSWNLVNFLSQHEKDWLTSCGYIQPRKGWTNDPTVQQFPFINVWEEDMSHGHYVTRSVQYSQITDILGRAVDGVLKQHEPIDQALQQAQSQAQSALNG